MRRAWRFETLAAADPGSVQKQGDILETYGVLADNAERAERFTEALEWAERASRRLDQVEREKHMSKAFVRGEPGAGQHTASDLQGRGQQSETRGRSAMPSPELRLPFKWLAAVAGFALARRRRHAEAAALAKDLRQAQLQECHHPASVQPNLCPVCDGRRFRKTRAGTHPELRKLEQNYIDSTLDAFRQVLRLAPEMASMPLPRPTSISFASVVSCSPSSRI